LPVAPIRIAPSDTVPEINWQPAQYTGSVAARISAAFHKGELLMVYKGRGSNEICENIRGVQGGAIKWLGETRIADHSTPGCPAIATAGSRAVMAYVTQAGGNDERMRMCVRVGEQWRGEATMGSAYLSKRSPALASDDKNVYLAFSALPSDELRFDSCATPASDSEPLRFANPTTTSCGAKTTHVPTIASSNGSVYVAYVGEGGSIWYAVPKSPVPYHQPSAMVPGIKGKSPCLVTSGSRIFLFFLASGGRRIGYSVYNGKRWNEFRYHTLEQPAYSIVVAVEPTHPQTFHLLYTSARNKKVYHSIGQAK
jgi:hypothetical protein